MGLYVALICLGWVMYTAESTWHSVRMAWLVCRYVPVARYPRHWPHVTGAVLGVSAWSTALILGFWVSV